MKCEQCRELLIDYMDNGLSSELMHNVKDHISTCSKCAKEFQEYTEIQMAAQAQQLPEVSSEVLNRLSKAASDDIKKISAPFWKKWSYSPILVPTLTTAIALSVWFYYGNDAVNFGASEQEQVALKTQADSVLLESEYGDSSADENIEIENPPLVAEESYHNLRSESVKQSREFAYDKPPASPTESKVSSDSKFEQETQELAEVDLYDSQDMELHSRRKVEASPTHPMSLSGQEQEELGFAKSKMQRGQYEMSSQKKIQEDCEVSIRTNEAIINSSEPISESVQKRSFRSLALCYEQKGDYKKAISNYINLEQVAPEEASFANSRIQEIRNIMELEQNQQKQLSVPQPAN